MSLSYSEAGRWLDAQGTVEQVPRPPEVVEWVRAFAAEHLRDQAQAPQAARELPPLVDRFGNVAACPTEKKRGRGAGDV